MKVKEFEKKTNIEIIQDLIKENNGYITSKLISELGIHRMYLKIMLEKGLIKKVDSGIYISPNIKEDNFYIFTLKHENIVYSHLTALYFYGLSANKPTDKYYLTLPNNYFNYKVKGHNVFYVDKKIFNIGLTTFKTKYGHTVKTYDVERCICDIVKSKNRIDRKELIYSIKKYFKSKDKDLDKLSKYASLLGISKEINEYIELLSD